MRVTQLSGWKKLTKNEKERLKNVYAGRIKENYDMEGKLSTSKKELKHG